MVTLQVATLKLPVHLSERILFSPVFSILLKLPHTTKKWREKPLSVPIKYLLLDARYEKVRLEDNTVVDCALLIPYGINEEGRRCVLGVSVKLSEAEVHWRKFLESLVARGLRGIKLIVSDNHNGLKAVRKSVFPSVPWQRCQFHLQQNASAHIPKKSMQQEVHNDIRDVFNMPTRSDAEIQLKKLIGKYGKTAADLAQWLEEELPEGFTVEVISKVLKKQERKGFVLKDEPVV